MDYLELFIACGSMLVGIVAVLRFFLGPLDKKIDGIENRFEKRMDRLEGRFDIEIKEIKSELKDLKTHFDKRLDQFMAAPKS